MFKNQLLLLLCILSSTLAGAHFIAPVNSNGSDTNPGTFKKPWRTLSYALCGGSNGCPCTTLNKKRLSAGDTLYLRGGYYNVATEIATRPMTFANSGTNKKPIIVRNYPGEKPIIDGNYSNLIFQLGEYASRSSDGTTNYIKFDKSMVDQG